MKQVATLDWTCSQCGTTETWQLVMTEHRDEPEKPESGGPSHPPPTLDWTCAQCGRSETWQLVKAGPAEASQA
jgi:predicted nucleic-acid-binding Zn-ribbon protein